MAAENSQRLIFLDPDNHYAAYDTTFDNRVFIRFISNRTCAIHILYHEKSSDNEVHFFLPDFEAPLIDTSIPLFKNTFFYLYCANQNSVTSNKRHLNERAFIRVFHIDRLLFHLRQVEYELLIELAQQVPYESDLHDNLLAAAARRLTESTEEHRQQMNIQLDQHGPYEVNQTIAAPSSALDFQCESHPVVYIVGFELSLLNLHPNTAQVIRVKTDKQAVNDISKLNPQFSFYILSPESAPPGLLANQFLRHYYYVPEPVLHAGKTLTIRDRVTNIGSIERFSSELYTDLAQYYRDKAYKALLEQHDREEIKVLLEKSKKCLEMLKYIIESFAANTMEVPVTT